MLGVRKRNVFTTIFKAGKLATFCSTKDSGKRLRSYTDNAARTSSHFFFLSDETVRIAFKVNQTCDMPINASIERKKSLEFSFFLFEVILKYMYRKSNINNFLFKPHAILTNSKTVQKD